MKHQHKHSCSCEHEQVKFCKTCQVVHCLDCAKEWGKPYQYWYQPYTWTNPSIPQTLCNTTTLTTTATACTHEDQYEL